MHRIRIDPKGAIFHQGTPAMGWHTMGAVSLSSLRDGVGRLLGLSILFLCFLWESGVSSPPLEEKGVAAVHTWLAPAYIEGVEFAGFGDLSPDIALTPNLYSTFGAVHALFFLGEEIGGEQEIGGWINSLLDKQGAYDDPLNNAPLVFETYWACSTLKLLGIQPAAPERTAAFLLHLQGEDGLFRFDSVIESSLWDNVSCTHLVSETFHLLGFVNTPQVASALTRARERVAQLVEEELASWQGEALDIKKDEHLLAALKLLAALGGDLPERGKAALQSFLAAIEHAPTGFLGPRAVDQLLDAAERAGLLRSQEIPRLPGLRRYLLERVTPEIFKTGGYGWRKGWAAKLDPVMTWPAVRLFKRAGLEYPGRSALLAALKVHRIDRGWMTFTLAVPKVDFTFFGVSIAQLTGWRGYDERKVRAFALSVLHHPEDLRQFYWAAKLGRLVGIDEKTLRSLIDTLNVHTQVDLYWYIQLLFEFNLPPPPEIVASLSEIAEMLVQKIQDLPHIKYIRDLFRLQRVLGREWFPERQLVELVCSLQDPASGGFKAFPTSPGADLLSTWAAVNILGGADGEFDKEKCRSFVFSCWWEHGFAWAPKGSTLLSSPPDLFSTYVGLKLLQLLGD